MQTAVYILLTDHFVVLALHVMGHSSTHTCPELEVLFLSYCPSQSVVDMIPVLHINVGIPVEPGLSVSRLLIQLVQLTQSVLIVWVLNGVGHRG